MCVYRAGPRRARYNWSRSRLLKFASFIAAVKFLSDIWISRFLDNISFTITQEPPVSWIDERLTMFSAPWQSHKVRNLAIYACVSTRRMFLLKTITYHLLACPDVFYHGLFDYLFHVPAWCFSHNCLEPFGRSHYLYATFVTSTYEWITSLDLEPPAPTAGCKIAVLVEPREHPLFEYTVKQVMSTLGAGWSLQLFVSKYNEDYVRRQLNIEDGKKGRHIIVTRLSEFGLDDMAHSGNRIQSAFSAHKAMYSALRGEHILWFQIDVILRHSPPSAWLQYAYIGSEWLGCEFPSCTAAVCKRVCGGGNSGLSLRRKSALLPIATKGKLPEDLWGLSESGVRERPRRDYFEDDEEHNNSETRWFEDDLQISFKLSKRNLLPPGEVPSQFAIGEALPKEGIDRTDPCGMHKTWMTPHISPSIIERLLEMPYRRAQVEYNRRS